MRKVKISRWLASAVVFSLLLAVGCAPVGEEIAKPEGKLKEQIPEAKKEKTATLALKFSPGDSTTYRLITESERSIEWEGSVPEEAVFKGGRNHNRFEMTFDQEIKGVDDKGNAIAKIIIKELKYTSSAKSDSNFEFDSANPKDPNHPLAKMIGKSYTIRIAPTGEVVDVISIRDAEIAARKGSVVPRRALRLLKSPAIKERHGTLVLPDAGKNQLHRGESWSNIKTFNFGLMGTETHEKIYTLTKIIKRHNQQIAVVKMEAIPTSEMEEEQMPGFLKNSDITKTYTGKLTLDLTAGKIKEYQEKLQSKWVTAFPPAEEDVGEGPVVLIMEAVHFYHIEQVD